MPLHARTRFCNTLFKRNITFILFQQVDMDTISSSSLSKLAQDSNDELMLNSKEFEFCSLLSDTNNINENLLVQL